jgi:SecD/SecF fusion protein
MASKPFYKLAAACLFLACAVYSIFPLKDQDFASYLKKRANQEKSAFAAVLQDAEAAVKAGEFPSLFLALKSQGDTLDYNLFFKDLKVLDVPELSKRNAIILNHLLKESKGKIKQGLDLYGGVGFTLALPKELGQPHYLNKAIEVVSKRIDGLGIAEPLIRPLGSNSIEVQLPGINLKENPNALQALRKPAKLEFRFLHDTESPLLNASATIPAGYERLTLSYFDKRKQRTESSPHYVKRLPVLTGKAIKEAYLLQSPSGSYEIGLKFNAEGTERFAQITRENIGRHLGIVLDGALCCAPVINTEIPNGSATIQGDFSYREALDLVNTLNNPLEFELALQELYEVGPSLAKEAREASLYAALLGASLVIGFMMLYYRKAGLIAVVSVLFNVALVIIVQTLMGATLTLPAIGALVLTIGMGVDANILIFERMREELASTKNMASALEAAHRRAFSTILDANLTSLLTAFILMYFGSGPVKGFGLTLSVGIISSMFCVLYISRWLLELFIHQDWLGSSSFSKLKNFNVDFLKLTKPSLAFSLCLALVSLYGFWTKRDSAYGIDFKGGEEIALRLSQPLALSDIHKALKAEGIDTAIAVYQTNPSSKEDILKIQTDLAKGRIAFEALKKSYPNLEVDCIGETTIGASVSHNLKKDAFLALGLALLGIMTYVAFRFEIGFGVGALISTVYDVFLSVGLFIAIGGQINAPMLAAVLMIIGYSINDTIVVFDRIREELQKDSAKSLAQTINCAINKTLSRTLLTSLTTLLATLALYIFGVGPVKDFACVFLIGIGVGTFSSIFIASPIFYKWHKGNKKHLAGIRQAAGVEDFSKLRS